MAFDNFKVRYPMQSQYLLLIVTPICNCSLFCCALLYVHSSFAIILMGKRELVVLLSFSSWCLLIVVWLFLAVPSVCLQFVIVIFPDHIYLLFLGVIRVNRAGSGESANLNLA